ncbi:MAG: hypothetical protein B6U94_01605 [Thermofilum sp. ex4484_79]|nr:MAG: hypothetical protein B6U94_01605 [Thermofilum sp. ex4484_79]
MYKDKRILILGDLEGVSGVVSFDTDTAPGQINYERSLRLATGELNALIRGLRNGGAGKITFIDGHGYGGINFELIDEDIDVIMGRPLYPPFGFGKEYDGVVLFAHHAMAGTPNANLCHSWSHSTIYECRLNNEPIGEIGWYSYLAAYYGIPVILVTGDDKACNEAKRYVPDIETAVVKIGLNTTAAICKPPKISQKIIEKAARNAMARIESIKPAVLPRPPYVATRTYLDPKYAESFLKHRPWAEKVDERTVRVRSKDYLELTTLFL